MKKSDLSGKKFNRLVVISGEVINNKVWCRCDCGNEKWMNKSNIVGGYSKSCGCLHKESVKKSNSKHGMRNTKIYTIWCAMRDRCDKEYATSYKNYGARGIKVCKEWYDFKTFYNWSLSSGYKEGLSIERINNDGDYEPNNCEWILPSKQSHNTRRTKKVLVEGELKAVIDICRKEDVSMVNQRIKRGWSVADALSEPKISGSPYPKNKYSKHNMTDD